MNRDSIVETRPAIDFDQIKIEVNRKWVAFQKAEQAEGRAAEEHEQTKEERLRCQLELGRELKRARAQWPAKSGIKAKPWGDLLRESGIPSQRASELLAYAGYVEEHSPENKDSGKSLPLPTFKEAGIDTKPRKNVFGCADCGETFGAPVWHCPGCAHHYHAEDDECGNCHEYKSDGSRITAEDDDGDPDPGESRPMFHAEAQKRLPPTMDAREERTAQLRSFWDSVFVNAKKLGAHLTDATTSPDDFHAVKNTLIAVANLVLEELEKAGVLTADGKQKQRLLVLDGGNGK